MRGIKDKGLEELKGFRNRLTRSHGMERIGRRDFKDLYELTNRLIEKVEEVDEKDEYVEEK